MSKKLDTDSPGTTILNRIPLSLSGLLHRSLAPKKNFAAR